jgi:hypothetical protein
LTDQLYISPTIKTLEGATFLQSTAHVEILCNTILALISPDLYSIGMDAIKKIHGGEALASWHDNVKLWLSAFSGIQVISNRVTPPHRDSKAAPAVFDLLVSAGTHKKAHLTLHDIKTELMYKPGTVVAICGKVLLHEVKSWEGGERICIAHFIRDAVHSRLGLPRPDWVTRKRYVDMMHSDFRVRHKLVD